MRPWLLHVGPLFIPTDGREELQAIAATNTPDEYIDKVWRRREEAKPQQTQSLCNWPAVTGAQEAEAPQTSNANVTRINKKATRA